MKKKYVITGLGVFIFVSIGILYFFSHNYSVEKQSVSKNTLGDALTNADLSLVEEKYVLADAGIEIKSYVSKDDSLIGGSGDITKDPLDPSKDPLPTKDMLPQNTFLLSNVSGVEVYCTLNSYNDPLMLLDCNSKVNNRACYYNYEIKLSPSADRCMSISYFQTKDNDISRLNTKEWQTFKDSCGVKKEDKITSYNQIETPNYNSYFFIQTDEYSTIETNTYCEDTYTYE